MTDFLPVDQVSREIAQGIQAVNEHESLALTTALGRIVAFDVLSPIDVPGHPNSAMDGYAFHSDALATGANLTVIGTALAGQPFDEATHTIATGQCIRIMTGAVLPAGVNTVAPQEHCIVDGTTVTLQPQRFPLSAGQNTRKRGEDLEQGQAAVHAGRALTASDIGLLASLGLEQVQVKRRVRVAIFSTGDELVAPGKPLGPGQIYDSNRFTLTALLTRLQVEVIDLGLVRDQPELLEQALQTAMQQHRVDAIITSGGVSVGEADFTRTVLAKLGQVNFWQIAMRPGRPLAFGHLNAPGRERPLLFFGLPGNPVAVMMTFYFFARAALLQLQGAQHTVVPQFSAKSAQAMRKKPGRTEFQRAVLSRNGAGEYQVALTGQQGSGVLSSMSRANCLVVLHHEQTDVNAGDAVSVVPFEGLL
jgi:molybdopterin molybdotransferase